jgi:hypothetical protein
MEFTMLRRFERLNRLRLLILNNLESLPPLIALISPVLSSICGVKVATLITASFPVGTLPPSPRFQKLPTAVYKALLEHFNRTSSTPFQSFSSFPLDSTRPILSPRVELIRTYSRGSRQFSSFDHHRGNSHVLVKDPSQGEEFYGRIEIMFRCYEQKELKQDEIYVGFRAFVALSEGLLTKSPFTLYPSVRGSLFSQTLTELLIVKLRDVSNHLAVLSLDSDSVIGFDQPLYACISLDCDIEA